MSPTRNNYPSQKQTTQQIIVFVHPDQAGQTVSFRAGDQELGEVTLEAPDHSALATFDIPEEVESGRTGSVAVMVDGEVLEYVTPDTELPAFP